MRNIKGNNDINQVLKKINYQGYKMKHYDTISGVFIFCKILAQDRPGH